MRDQTLPTAQAELDEFAYNLSTRFAAQGLTLFTDPHGSLPTGGGSPAQSTYVGFSLTIQPNPTVQANPSLVRDGTNSINNDPNGASAFTLNGSTGPAGFTTLISRVLNYALGIEAQAGVPQPQFTSANLGPAGSVTAHFSASSSLGDYAASMTAGQSADSGATARELSTEQAVQTALQSQVSTISGVNVDTEMSKMIALQNAYSANARVITVAQSMFNQILQATQ